MPDELECECLPLTIVGVADAAAGEFDRYTIEARPVNSGVWNLLFTGVSPVTPSGPLYTWNDIFLAEGYHEIRLTVRDTVGAAASDEVVVYVNRSYDTLDLRGPVAHNPPASEGIYGGRMCIDGTVYDGCGQDIRLEYRAAGGFVWALLSGSPVSGTVINDPIGPPWDTRSGADAVADGEYDLRITGTSNCGQLRSLLRRVLIDNTAPIAQISSPVPCTYAQGIVTIRGAVSDANLSGRTLQYAGGPNPGWTRIASGNAPVPPGGVLANWDTTGLAPCAYTLRLISRDKATVNCITSNTTEHTVSIDFGCKADVNRSGAVSVQDIFDFLAEYFAGCI